MNELNQKLPDRITPLIIVTVIPEGNQIWVLGDGVGRHTIFGYCRGGTDHKLLAHTVPASGGAGRLAMMTNKELAAAITKNNVKASR